MNHTINILNDAKHEITTLRRTNEILLAKVEVMELFASVLCTQPPRPTGTMGVDTVWQLEKEIARLQDAEDKKPQS